MEKVFLLKEIAKDNGQLIGEETQILGVCETLKEAQQLYETIISEYESDVFDDDVEIDVIIDEWSIETQAPIRSTRWSLKTHITAVIVWKSID